MKTTLQVASIIAITIGAFAILGSISPYDVYGMVGGLLFAAQGILSLVYIKVKEG